MNKCGVQNTVKLEIKLSWWFRLQAAVGHMVANIM